MSTPRTSRSRRRPDAFTVIKDVTSYLGGWALIGHQALVVAPADFNLTLVLLGGTLVGIPGVSQLLALRTGGSPSPDPPADSSVSPRRSSATSEADR